MSLEYYLLNNKNVRPISHNTLILTFFKDRNKRFIPELLDLLENAVTVEENLEGEIITIRPEGKYIIVNQDEKIHHSNDVQKM